MGIKPIQPKELSSVTLDDLFDRDELYDNQKDLAETFNVGLGFFDVDFKPYVALSNNSPVLDELILSNPRVREYFNCNLETIKKLNIKSNTVIYNKQGDMMVSCILINIENRTIGYCYVFGVFDEETKKTTEEYRMMARDFQVDEEVFLAGLELVPVMSKSQFEGINRLITLFVEKITHGAYTDYKNNIELIYRSELIKELEEVNELLNIQTERYQLLSEASNEIIFDYNCNTDTMVVPAGKMISKIKDAVITDFYGNERFKDYLHPDDADMFKNFMYGIINSPKQERKMLEIRSDFFGEDYRWYCFNALALKNEAGTISRMIGVIKDVNEEHIRQELLESQAKRDPLTRLLNKTATQYAIEEFLSESDEEECHAMMIVDIDNFKQVNDNFGHLFGDVVIQNVANAIRATFRKSDIIGRIGGDEFLVLMKNAGKRVAEIKANEICNKVKKVYYNKDVEVEVSCSVGIAYYIDDGRNYDELFVKTDIAMYNAKSTGKNTVKVYDEGHEQFQAELTVEDEYNAVKESENGIEGIMPGLLLLLLKSNDLGSAIRLAIEKICNRFELTNIVITGSEQINVRDVMENKRKGEVLFAINEEKEYNLNNVKVMDDDNVLVVNDCSTYDEDGDLKAFFEKNKISAAVCTKMYMAEGYNSYMFFTEGEIPRNWLSNEIKLFTEISKLFSVFMRLNQELIKND